VASNTTRLNKRLRRYTDLPALIYLLRRRRITLLDPRTWDDRNDSYYLRLFRNKRKLKCVLALCFTRAPETYHHWRVFSTGSSGVCIEFDRAALLRAVSGQDVRSGDVTYRTRNRMRSAKLTVHELPFLKRRAFRDDIEFRMIYRSATKKRSKLDIAIPLSCIHRVTLSPWLDCDVADEIRQTLRSIRGCANLGIARSTLVNNEEWKQLGETAV
jgi:hypothetical protein